MGVGNSRSWRGQRPRRRSPSPRQSGKRRYFRRRQPTTTTVPLISAITQSVPYQPLFAGGLFPAYARIQPISSPHTPFAFNNYSAPASPQYMMMMSPSTPSPYMSPPILQQAPVQPLYNNVGYPGSIPGGNMYYPPSYASAPMRLITDWTGGGKISPGFLGPPI